MEEEEVQERERNLNLNQLLNRLRSLYTKLTMVKCYMLKQFENVFVLTVMEWAEAKLINVMNVMEEV